VTVEFAEVDLDVDGPRTAAGWTAFGSALVVPYGFHRCNRGLVNWRANRDGAT
jgi:hypothetical protein